VSEYDNLKSRLAQGWNTWNTLSVLSHVLLPDGFALNLGVKEYPSGAVLRQALIGRKDQSEEQVHPGRRTRDGSYTSLNLKWKGVDLDVETAKDGDDLTVLVTPRSSHLRAPLLVVEGGMLWNRPGAVQIADGAIEATLPSGAVTVSATAAGVDEPYTWAMTPYLAIPLEGPVGLSTGRRRGLDEIAAAVAARKADCAAKSAAYGELAEVHDAIHTCVAWDTVYDPQKDRVVSPVSRIWSSRYWGGCVLFCWDPYFAALLAAVENRDLAYANAIEMTHEKTPQGFVPNARAANGFCTHDRSQPPVGSMMVREIYRLYPESWFLEEVFDDLLGWNRWWSKARDNNGFLSWGSNPFAPRIESYWEREGIDDRLGAALESGLDNSPMYDAIPFDKERHVLELADAGLMGLYLGDCEALAWIAETLGRDAEAAEVRGRAGRYSASLARLWDDDFGLFLNRRTDTGEPSRRISPTNFYPLLGRVATQEEAERMMQEHFYNPEEFWGEWVLPSISRNDPAYPDNEYWRGRIWAPMNFLVYLGLRNYDLPKARADLAGRSKALLLKEWREFGHVHENYNADTGAGCDVKSSDGFYHWGALLGLIALMEAGRLGE